MSALRSNLSARTLPTRPTRRSTLQPLCALSVQLDGDSTEILKVYEGEDPKLVVEDFGLKYNLSDNAMRRLLKQVEQQLMLY